MLDGNSNSISINGKLVAVDSSNVVGTIVSTMDGLAVLAGNGTYVLITEVQPENKKHMSATDFINGHQIKGGMCFDK